MHDTIIRIEGLGKKYSITHKPRERYTALRDVIMNKTKALCRRFASSFRNRPSDPGIEDFWALRDVSIDVKQGEVVGIIGPNGAGKSTLLKILSRITEPTTGTVRLKGRVASLLEVGTGFHPELTGRENIFLNGAILGMTKEEIKRKFDEIVAFAETEKFLDTPVKRYSNGMYVRLAFAVAAHLEAEILLVDEVLSVGDAQFQKKCLNRMDVVASSGRTVLFVSHQMPTVQSLCSRALLLEKGRVLADDRSDAVIERYTQRLSEKCASPLALRGDRKGNGLVRFTDIEIEGEQGKQVNALRTGDPACFVFRFENPGGLSLKNFRFSVGIDDISGYRIALFDSQLVGHHRTEVCANQTAVRVIIDSLPLMSGKYRLTVFCSVLDQIVDWIQGAAEFNVEPGDFFKTGRLPPHTQGRFLIPHRIEYS
jgi:lipopolysaccharide transport system ATP-binding protein